MQIQLPGMPYRDVMEVKKNGWLRRELWPTLPHVLPQVPQNIDTTTLPMSNALKSANQEVLESCTDKILPVHGTEVIQVAHYKTQMTLPVHLFIVNTNNVIIVSHAANTQIYSRYYAITEHSNVVY